MRPALWSVAIQASGSAATVACALLVSSRMGLAAQGEFGLLRSWNDAFVTLAVIGLPQGLLHMQYRESVSVPALRAWVERYLMCLFAFAAVFAVLALWVVPALNSTGPFRQPAIVAVMAFAIALGAAHQLWRSLALRDVGVVAYAAITAAPAILTLIGLVPVTMTGRTDGFVWALFGAALVSAIASAALVRRVQPSAAVSKPSAMSSNEWSRRKLWSVSAETGVQNVLTALSPALVLSVASSQGASLEQIGVVSLGLHVYALFGVAAAYVAPMVYDRAARSEQVLTGAQLIAWMRERTTPRMLLALAASVVLALVLIRWLWPAGADSLVMLSMMAAAGAVSMAVRLIITLLLARGAFRPLTFQALGRLVFAAGGTALLMRFLPAASAVPVVIVCTEMLLLVWLLRLMHRQPAGALP
jgi:hypothetical protein